MSKKLSLKSIESLIEAQAVIVALTELGRHQNVFPEVINGVAALANETMADLLGEHTRRTNEGRTEKLMKRIAKRLAA